MYIYFSNIMKKVYWTLKMIMVAFMLRENRCIREGKTITLTYFRCRRLGEELSWQALMAALRPWAELHSWACYRRLQWYDNTATWRCVHMTDSRLHPWERHRSVQPIFPDAVLIFSFPSRCWYIISFSIPSCGVVQKRSPHLPRWLAPCHK